MRNSDADIAIDVLNKLIAQELEAASAGMRLAIDPSRKVRRFDTTPISMPGTRFGRRSPMPWMSGTR